MPRGKKNKGNAGSAAVPNNNKAKSPAETKVAESAVTLGAAALPVDVEPDTSNEDLKARLANAKERLHILQEVIGGIGDPTDVENLKASGIDAAKEKLNIIQDSVNSVKTTLLEVRQETARSVTPEGSASGTNKKRKNKKHHNQNPPQGAIVQEKPAPKISETKLETETPENESSVLEQQDGTSTISKKKRNRNKKNKGQQEQSPAPDSLPQQSNVSEVEVVAVKIDESLSATKENSPEANKSKNNKKNNKKGQQKSTNEKVESTIAVDAEVKPADQNIVSAAEVKTDIQSPSNDKNKNKNKNKKAEDKNKDKDTEKDTEPSEDHKDELKVQGDINILESKTDNTAKDKQKSAKTEDLSPQKENHTKTEDANVKNQPPKIKNEQKKEPIVEENPVAINENILPIEIGKVLEKEQNVKAEPEQQKLDAPKNKKDKKKGQTSDSKQSPSKVEEKQAEIEEVITASKNEAKVIDTQPAKVETQKDASKSEEKTEKTILAPASPIEEKKVSDSSQLQPQKSKKNKHQASNKNAEKHDKLEEEQKSKLVTDIKSSEQVVTDISKATTQVQCEETCVRKDECNKNETCTSTPAVNAKLPEKQERLAEAVPVDIVKADRSPKPTVAEDIASKTKIEMAIDLGASLPKLDFSQVVKDNKDKIPLMEIKAAPVSITEAVVEAVTETKTLDSATKTSSDSAIKCILEVVGDKPVVDALKIVDNVTTKPIVDTVAEEKPKVTADSKPLPEVASKPTAEATSKPLVDTLPADSVEPKINTPVPKESDATTCPKQNKAKTPERKGNQANPKNEQKKQQQGKGQCAKQKQNDQKSQENKREDIKQEEVKPTEIIKVDTEIKVVAEKVETKLDSPTSLPSTEPKLNEEITEQKENLTEQVKQKSGESKSESKSAPKEDAKGKGATQKKLDAAEKQQPLIQDKTDKNLNKKSVETPLKAEKSESPSVIRQAQQQKQEQKTEISKKDQKKQNKMKGKAPQPPDIPMDMSILSASMIDPVATDEVISREESEDQSSLITSDSKNVAGSDFVQSVDSSLLKAIADETKSLETIPMTPKNENKVTEIEREAKNSSPSSSKRNKDMANLKESVEMQETKLQELPEKSAQQKLEPVQFPAVQLMDILEAKMTSPAVKPGQIAGNVRKLPKDTKRSDQLNVQQQKSRSKSPKENVAEKYVKNQKLASGDNKKQAPQNLKYEILKTEVGSLVTPIIKEKEVKEPTKSDVNLSESKTLSGTPSTAAAVTEAEQVGNLKESDVISKTEPLPKKSTVSDTKLQQSNDDGKTCIAVGGKSETKPKIAPKPNVPLKTSPKDVVRSKKSPVKTPESKTPRKESPAKETATPSKASTQTKPTQQSKSPVQVKPATQSKSPAQTKPATQSKSPSQSKAPSQPTAVATSSSKQASDAQCANVTKPEVPPKPEIPKASKNKMPVVTSIPDEEEEFVEYKFTPRPVFISTACQICKVPLDVPNPCKLCQMVSYCSEEHEKEDQISHGPLCSAIQEIAKKRGGHIYNNARILNDDDYRSLRVHTLNLCENFLKRHLLPYEREILLFPRLCCTGSCREWRQQSLVECKQCGQVSYCAAHPEHLPQLHEKWCKSFNLYQKIVLRQKNFGRIEPSLPSKISLKPFDLSDNIDNVFKILYKNYDAIKDECIYATLTQLATAPLTALYAAQKNQQQIGEVYTIHLVGAELQFEADTLDKWETFFLHLVPTLVECRVVFVGPELNAENLPLEVLSRIRMCRTCRQNCRIVKFDFQCGILYHDYVNSSAFTKPDLVCFFNPGLYRTTGFNGRDTWPNTIKSAASMNCPIAVTSYTEYESPKDLERIQKESDRPLSVVQPPQMNPFASQRPERNFISDEIAPMIFKNFFCFCVK